MCDSKHRRAHLVSKTPVTRENWTGWSLSRIPGLLHLCLSQPYARFGDSVWMQRQGVPIGDLISGGLCSVLLGFAQHQRASMEAEEAKLPGHVKVCTARLRYVDDQIWLTATDCHSCVEKHFVTSDGTNRAEWLDVVVELTHDGTLCLGPKKAELEWAHKPDVPCGRYLVPPFVNHLSLGWVLLCGMVKCRCARLLQMCFPKDALHSDMRSGSGGVQGKTRVSLLSDVVGSGSFPLWKSMCAYVTCHRPTKHIEKQEKKKVGHTCW